jgi:hypothetical protein
MLSRNADITKTMRSRTSGPAQFPGRMAGSLSGDPRIREVLREDREAEEEPEEVREDVPLVAQVLRDVEAPEELPDEDRRHPADRDPEGSLVEARDPDQRQTEQIEFDRYSDQRGHSQPPENGTRGRLSGRRAVVVRRAGEVDAKVPGADHAMQYTKKKMPVRSCDRPGICLGRTGGYGLGWKVFVPRFSLGLSFSNSAR